MEDDLKQWERLTSLVNKLKRIGIEIKLGGNVPWIYLEYINGKRVKERFLANHGFTIAWYPTKNKDVELTDITEIFKVIRKYL